MITIKEAIDKYIGLNTIKGITEIRNIGYPGNKTVDINDFLDYKISEDRIWYWKSGKEKKFGIEFRKGFLEWINGKWTFDDGTT